MQKQFRKALFISDLHLTEARPDCIRAFYQFLHQIPNDVDALFILGDFFEYWLGDDVTSELAGKIAEALVKCSQTKKLSVFFLVGNRDFAVGKRYAKTANMQLIDDGSEFMVSGQKIVVAHGDLYCTDDVSYQRFRRVIRHPLVLAFLKSTPARYRQKLANKLRDQSKQKFKRNPIYIDVNKEAVEEAMQPLAADILVHGHTHLANIHEHETFQRVVLGDWHNWGWFARIDENGATLHRFAIKDPHFEIA